MNSEVVACTLSEFGAVCRRCYLSALERPANTSLRSAASGLGSIRPAPGEMLASESAPNVFTCRNLRGVVGVWSLDHLTWIEKSVRALLNFSQGAALKMCSWWHQSVSSTVECPHALGCDAVSGLALELFPCRIRRSCRGRLRRMVS